MPAVLRVQIAPQPAPAHATLSRCRGDSARAEPAFETRDPALRADPLASVLARCVQARSPRAPGLALLARAVDDAVSQSDRLTSPRFAGEPRLEACFENRARMSVGARDAGERQPVSKLQQALIDLGFELGETAADGVFGPLTRDAVKAFKRD